MPEPTLVLTNTATSAFNGWLETVIPNPSSEGPVVLISPHGRPEQAYLGLPLGSGRRAYFNTKLEPVTQLLASLGPANAPITRPPLPVVPVPRVGATGLGEVIWTIDTQTQDGPCAVRKIVGRAGPFVATLIAWRFELEPWTRFEFSFHYCDPRIQDLDQKHSGVTLAHAAAYVHVVPPALEARATALAVGGWARNVYAADTLGNGQGHTALRGMLLFYADASLEQGESMQALLKEEPTCVASNWHGKLGTHLAVSALSPLLGDGREAALSRLRSWQERALATGAWDETELGMRKDPSSTGDQEEFGLGKAAEVLAPQPPAPYNLHELRHVNHTEWRRPIHYREINGSPVRAAAHPNWKTWSEQTHWHPQQSPDRLGKPDWWGPWENHGCAGRDNQHASMMRLCGLVQIDGSRLMLEEVNDHIELWLSSLFDDAGRGRGRHMDAAVWLWLLTQRADLRAALDARIQLNADTWPSRNNPQWKLQPSTWGYPDNRQLQGRWPWWNGWNESLCAPGLWAAAVHLDGEPAKLARELARRSAYTVTRYAWFQRGGVWFIANGIRYLGWVFNEENKTWEPDGSEGTPLPVEAYQDESQVEIAIGAFPLWSYGCLWIAAELSKTDPSAADVYARATEIMAFIRSTRKDTGTFDRMDDWMAIMAAA